MVVNRVIQAALLPFKGLKNPSCMQHNDCENEIRLMLLIINQLRAYTKALTPEIPDHDEGNPHNSLNN
jgi:hypothetical protein